MGEFVVTLAFGVATFVAGIGLGHSIGEASSCRDWAGESAVIIDEKCMVPTKDGVFRPARKDGGERD